jgi:hypothetical protein
MRARRCPPPGARAPALQSLADTACSPHTSRGSCCGSHAPTPRRRSTAVSVTSDGGRSSRKPGKPQWIIRRPGQAGFWRFRYRFLCLDLSSLAEIAGAFCRYKRGDRRRLAVGSRSFGYRGHKISCLPRSHFEPLEGLLANDTISERFHIVIIIYGSKSRAEGNATMTGRSRPVLRPPATGLQPHNRPATTQRAIWQSRPALLLGQRQQ